MGQYRNDHDRLARRALGFKLDLGQVMLPVVFVGALLALSGKKAVAGFGLALAGFSLISLESNNSSPGLDAFRGVVTLPISARYTTGQAEACIDRCRYHDVTQSSSAGVATALAALEARVP